MKRKHIHTRTISRLPPEAFIEEYINEKQEKNLKFNEQQQTPKKKKRNKKAVARVVLLGTENTGKTSIFNQLRFFCGSNASNKKLKNGLKNELQSEIKNCRWLCIKHLINCAHRLCKTCVDHKNLFDHVLESNREIIIKYASISYSDTFTTETPEINNKNELNEMSEKTKLIKHELKAIFKDAGIIKTYIFLAFNLELNSEYFLNRLYKYFDAKYECTFTDYIHLYHETDTICDELIEDERWSITITDVCGHRRLRTQWLSLFQTRYTAALFVINLSDYNKFQPLNKSMYRYNKLIEQFELLSNVIKIKQFTQNISNLIIILNKKDIFENSIQKHKISFYQSFPIFLVQRFYAQNQNKSYKDSIYDKDNNDVQLIGRKNRLQFVFDKTKEFDTEYIIEYIKKELVKMLPVQLQKKLRIYITCVIQDTFQYVVQTLISEIVHMEQMYKSDIN